MISFHHKRLNWPTDLSELDFPESPCQSGVVQTTGQLSIFKRARSGSSGKISKNVESKYKFEESRRVRSFRVYEAIKTDDSQILDIC